MQHLQPRQPHLPHIRRQSLQARLLHETHNSMNLLHIVQALFAAIPACTQLHVMVFASCHVDVFPKNGIRSWPGPAMVRRRARLDGKHNRPYTQDSFCLKPASGNRTVTLAITLEASLSCLQLSHNPSARLGIMPHFAAFAGPGAAVVAQRVAVFCRTAPHIWHAMNPVPQLDKSGRGMFWPFIQTILFTIPP